MDRVREARERAESFTKATIERRAAEQTWDEERAAWVQGFEEKTATIEQLQRELASTVDALNQERQDNVSHSRSNSPEVVMYLHPPPPPDSGTSNRMLELLQQSQEETARAQKELANLKNERDVLAEQVAALQRQMQQLTEDREELVLATKSTDGVLQFRSEQANISETEKIFARRREEELIATLATAESKAKQLQSELIATSADLRISRGWSDSLEQRMVEATALTLSSQTEQLLQSRLDEMERFAQILTNRAEQAENALKTLMAATGLKSDRAVEEENEDGYVNVYNAADDGIARSRSTQKKLEKFLISLQDDDESSLATKEKKGQVGTATGSVLDMENEDECEDEEYALVSAKSVSPARNRSLLPSAAPSPSKSSSRPSTASAPATATANIAGSDIKKPSSSPRPSSTQKTHTGPLRTVSTRSGRPPAPETLGHKTGAKSTKTTMSEPLRTSIDSVASKASSVSSRRSIISDTKASDKGKVARPLSAPPVRPGSTAGTTTGTSAFSTVSKHSTSVPKARIDNIKPNTGTSVDGEKGALIKGTTALDTSKRPGTSGGSVSTATSTTKPTAAGMLSSARSGTAAGSKARPTGAGKLPAKKKVMKEVARVSTAIVDGTSRVAATDARELDAAISATAGVEKMEEVVAVVVAGAVTATSHVHALMSSANVKVPKKKTATKAVHAGRSNSATATTSSLNTTHNAAHPVAVPRKVLLQVTPPSTAKKASAVAVKKDSIVPSKSRAK